MTIRNLEYALKPGSVALIGASRNANSVGGVIARNLVSGSFSGKIMFVNPKADTIQSFPCYPDIASLPEVPDLSIICTPASTVPPIVKQLGLRGSKAAVVISAGFAEHGEEGKQLQQDLLNAAKPHLFRLIGPNCVGLLIPGIGLNASFAQCNALPGKTAFLSQSGAVLTSIMDWANSREIGFSHLISLGGMADVDVGDLLDYLARDEATDSILLYIEHVTNPRKFMSAARAASRLKPVVVIKPGRHEESALAATSHTGALAGSDLVYDAAFHRAGILRVPTLEKLFDAAETLSRGTHIVGERLAILTNGGGIGVLATDRLLDQQGQLAKLSQHTIQSLSTVLPATWSHANPVDIIGDASSERYHSAFELLLSDPQVDAVLVINCPTAMVDNVGAAKVISSLSTKTKKPVFTSWLGSDGAAKARETFVRHRIPTFDTPGEAVDAFSQIVTHNRNQRHLKEVPERSIQFSPEAANRAKEIVRSARNNDHEWLSEYEAKQVLRCFDIPIVETEQVSNVDEAVQSAQRIGFPIALKILSPQITHKTDVGGVALNIQNQGHLIQTANAMLTRVAKANPEAEIEGFTVQPMAHRPRAHELIVGMTNDRTFGPVIVFGQGGTAVEVVRDQAVALPPLNTVLANELINRTRISKLLAGYRDRPPADLDAVTNTLLAVAHLVQEIPEIEELDINPLWADADGVLALDARIRIGNNGSSERLSISPYPANLVQSIKDRSGNQYELRPVKPEDVAPLRTFVDACDSQDLRLRFFSPMIHLPDHLAIRLTQIDYDREMAFVAFSDRQQSHLVGFVHLVMDPDRTTGEYSIMVRSDKKGHGLGYQLMLSLIAFARAQHLHTITGEVMAENTRMLKMCRELGFELHELEDDPSLVSVQKTLK